MKFYHHDMELDVPEGVYCPAEDSLLLASKLEEMDLSGVRCLDMGCGSGFLSVLLARKGAVVTAADISAGAVEITRANAAQNNAQIVFVRSDLFEKIKGKFDLIVFNPPYLPVDDKYAHEIFDGGITGRRVIERFLKESGKYMNEKGRIIMVISSLTGEKEVLAIAEACNFTAEILGREKIDWEELIVIALERKRQAHL